MPTLKFCIAALLLAGSAVGFGQSAPPSEADLPLLVADCNAVASSTKARAVRACESLEKAGRLSLVEPGAVTAYQRYRQARLEACRRRQASPRGASRGPSDC